MCVTGYNLYGYYNSYPATALLWDNRPSACNSTTIDRNRPTIGVAVDGTADYTNRPLLAVHIAYSDATSPPWLGSDGRASNWTCLSRGAPCQPGGNYDQACSVAADRNGRITSFDCQKDVTAQPDGKYYVCAFAADAAVPDNPTGTNQFQNAYSNNANLSDPVCGWVTLDRQPPAVTAQTATATTTAGQLVSFTASATDPAGVSGQFDWDFGDNTAHGGGAAATHTYTQPGTYQAKATTTDGAGNAGAGTVTITVAALPASHGGDGGSSGGSGQTGGGGGTSGVTLTGTPITPGTIAAQAGGGGTQRASIAGLDVLAPRRFSAGRRTSVPLAFTVDVAGKLEVTLLKGSRIVARKGAMFGKPGTYGMSLKVSKRLKAGTYALRFVFTPTGASKAVTKRLTLKVVRPRTKAHSSAATPLRTPRPETLRGNSMLSARAG